MREVPIGADVSSFLNVLGSFFHTSHVYLRELVQNALEATHQAVRLGADVQPIHLMVERGRDGNPAILRVSDGGIGMTADELALNLANVFFSGWSKAQDETLGIGQFGFGFYTVFLVAERVEVTSRSLRSPGTAHRWTLSRGAGNSVIEPISGALPPIGTTIEAHLDEKNSQLIDHEFIVENLRQQYLHAAYPIFVEGVPLGLPQAAGWLQHAAGRDAAAAEELTERYGWNKPPLAIHRLEIDNGGILAVVPDGVLAPALAVYRRGIRVTEQEIVPEPLNMFVCGVVDMVDISLKPDRETLLQDEDFERLRDGVRAGTIAALARLAEKDRSRLARIFEAHGQYLMAAMQRIEPLRRSLGLDLPIPRYYRREGGPGGTTTLRELLGASAAAPVLTWASDRGADQLFADRARHLGTTPVLLQDKKLYRLVRRVCLDHNVRMRHVATGYLDDVRRSMTRDDLLQSLFRDVAGSEWDVVCVDDIDGRLPIRIVTAPFAAEGRSVSSLFDSASGSDDPFSILRRLLEEREEHTEEPVNLIVVNTRNRIIRDLRKVLSTAPRDTLGQFARILVAFARFTSQSSVDAREFEKLNSEVLALLHERILESPHRRADQPLLRRILDVRRTFGRQRREQRKI